MQSLATYSFEANVVNPNKRVDDLTKLIEGWLVKKGATFPHAEKGSFASKTGDGDGEFTCQRVVSNAGVLIDLELMETAHTGAIFSTSIQIVATDSKVCVFASLTATPGDARVAPIGLYPRCPHLIRSFLEQFDDWKFAGQEIPGARPLDVTRTEDAQLLCRALRSKERRLPLVVVSVDEDERIWTDLHVRLAEHLVGLAEVAFVSAESSWVLTDELGPSDSCYLGAVRLYWPGVRADGSLPGIKWLPSRLAGFGVEETGMNRFLAIVRREVMSTAALTMEPPALIQKIRMESEKRRIEALELGARDRELDSIIEENARLASELDQANRTIKSLQWQVTYSQNSQEAANDETESDEGKEHASPEAGETRYYKKIGSGGGVDSLVITKACNHKESNWKPAFKGDKAEKGLLKLEGRNNWKSLAHCSACTGGGRWRVHW